MTISYRRSTGTMSVMLRLLTEPAANGDLVGHAEVVATGEIVHLHGIADLERLAQRLAGTSL